MYVAYSKYLEKRAPKVARFLKRVSFEPEVINQWILKIGRDKEAPIFMAKAWVKANPEVVNGWLGGGE